MRLEGHPFQDATSQSFSCFKLSLIWLCSLSFVTVCAARNAAASSSAVTNSSRPLGTRAVFGLPPEGMQINSIYFGVLPDWSKEGPIEINQALGKSISIIGDYIYIGSPDTNNPFGQIEWHSDEVVRLAQYSVYAPAILPYFSLDEWTDALSAGLVSAAANLNSQGVTVWLRPFYEMNGGWMPYGLNPTLFLQAWQSLWQALQNNSKADRTYLLWSPNVAYGDTDSNTGYIPYFPGQDMVDIAGLSFYFTGEDQTTNIMPDSSQFTNGFDAFYQLYGHHHPVVISETSAPHHYQIPSSFQSQAVDTEVADPPALSTLTTIPSSNSPSDSSIKSAWIQQLTGQKTAGHYPNLTAVSWFNYFKVGNYSQFVDFRAVNGDSAVESFFRQYLGNVSAYQGGFDGAASTLTIPWHQSLFLALVVALIIQASLL